MLTRLLDRLRSPAPTQAPPVVPPAPVPEDSTTTVVLPPVRLPFYRPTLHQFYVFHWAEASERLFDYIAQALQHLAPQLPADAQQALNDELERKRGRNFEHDKRFPFVRSQRLYPVTNHPDLYVAFFAYQEGPDMLLHFIWHLKKEAPDDYFTQQLSQYLWPGPQHEALGQLGESILLSAVIQDNTLDQQALATQLSRHFTHPESNVSPIALNLNGAATLYIQSQIPLNQKRSGAILFYESPQSEASSLADQLVTVEWPLIILYQLRLEQLYLKRYRNHLFEPMLNQNRALRKILAEHFATPSEGQLSPLFTSQNLKKIQRALTQLSGPQYHQLETLNQVEGCAQEAQLELKNLIQQLERSSAFQQSNWQPIIYQAEHYHDQLASDISSARHLAERASQAIQLLQTQADLLGTASDRQLNFIIGITGTALAVGQLIDNETAELLYVVVDTLIGILWQSAGLPPLTEENKTLILASVRLIIILLSILLAWLLLSIYLRQARK